MRFSTSGTFLFILSLAPIRTLTFALSTFEGAKSRKMHRVTSLPAPNYQSYSVTKCVPSMSMLSINLKKDNLFLISKLYIAIKKLGILPVYLDGEQRKRRGSTGAGNRE